MWTSGRASVKFVSMNRVNALSILTVAIGVAAIAIGAFAMLLPRRAAAVFGIAAAGSALAFVRSMGARDVFIGVLLLLVWRSGEARLLGGLYLTTALISGTDFLVVFANGSRRVALTHGVGCLAGVVLGLWFLL